eukprot:CAMPEP_0181472124 /NCGR_PEP_ID=MMETSP1110-20121109/39434_1 /TAXON_ID=174948 /ORGANISM="Symbiodinium sp., Strain CCMP421" /LENGTH=158 /DNA_ID=CAMNT_0023597175 /DNA_START=166 /DNA_END=642 /DNA_ORIENTATION=+
MPWWPKLQSRASDDVFDRKGAPNVPIQRLVPVVAEDEDTSVWNCYRSKVVLCSLVRERFVLCLTVDVQSSAILYLNRVPREGDNSLDQRISRSVTANNKAESWWRVEDDNISALVLAPTLRDLVNCELVTYVEVRVHGQGRNKARLDQETSDQKSHGE